MSALRSTWVPPSINDFVAFKDVFHRTSADIVSGSAVDSVDETRDDILVAEYDGGVDAANFGEAVSDNAIAAPRDSVVLVRNKGSVVDVGIAE